ncbi:MAG TPA: inorganic diphosphatase [Polyangiaceae bacterium]|jgi:inorganic pyrophosphatase|nr:inorganic diphosphatase [Polyangiaceae bacterium]
MGSIQNLPAWDADARLRVVVETPKGSGAKLRYDAMSGTFIYQRPLPNRLFYPYDFGFVPGTLADDGDPLDALVIHEAATWPGIVIPCLPIALLKIVDKKHDETSARQNHRLIAVPAATPAMEPALSDLQRVELEVFFRVVGQQLKEVTIVGWGDAEEARTEITRTIVNEQGARA